MGALWDSHYDGIKQLIDINPTKITWHRYSQKDNGRGVMIDDNDADLEEYTAWVRLSHQKSGVQNTAAASTGLTTNLSMYLLMLYDVDIQENEIFTVNTGTIARWKVGVVDELSVEGECYAKQAPLVRSDG
jgi:hypothetical protein